MGSVSTVLPILTGFADAAAWLIAAIVLFAHSRRIVRDNEKAHAAITESVQAKRRQIAHLEKRMGAALFRWRSRKVHGLRRAAWQDLLDPSKAG